MTYIYLAGRKCSASMLAVLFSLGQAALAAPPPATQATSARSSAAAGATLQIALQNLSLRDAVGIAIARHPDIARANAEIAQSAAQVEIAQAAWYPRLDYGLRPGYGGSFGTDGNRAGTRASIGVSQLVYDFGRTQSRISAADATLKQKNYELADAIEAVAYHAASSFLELAASQEVSAAAQRQVAALQQIRAKIADRARAGLSLASDRNLVNLALLRAQAAVLKADTRSNVAAARLSELIGARAQSVEGLAGAVNRVRGLDGDGGDIENTPAVLAAAAAVEAADARLRFAQAERLPAVSVGVNRSVSTGRADVTNDTWIGLSLNGNFSFGGLAQHQASAADAELRASRESLESRRLSTRSALHAAEVEADGAAARSASYAQLIALSRASRDLYWQEYMLNKRTLTDVVNPESDIFDAEVEGINAFADGALARLKAYAAVGSLTAVLRNGGRDD